MALREEARGVLKTGYWREAESSGSQAMYESRLGSVETVLAITGMGRVRAEESARAVLIRRRPDAVLSLGFAGGLDPSQRAGDLIVAQTLTRAEQATRAGEAIHADVALIKSALRLLAASGLRHRAGTCLTASQAVSSPDAKRRLGLATGAIAVDMESYWIGMACRERKTPFLAARSIVDTVERPLPTFALQLAARGARWKSVMSATLRPGSLPELVRLGVAASKARNSLSSFVEAFLSAWQPAEPQSCLNSQNG